MSKDQLEFLFSYQNWDHVLHLMRHLHLQPVTTHGTDFARIRPWALDGLTKYFSQTLVFSSILCPEHSALMSRHCHNYAGLVRVQNALSKGSICQVTVQLPQVSYYIFLIFLPNSSVEKKFFLLLLSCRDF